MGHSNKLTGSGPVHARRDSSPDACITKRSSTLRTAVSRNAVYLTVGLPDELRHSSCTDETFRQSLKHYISNKCAQRIRGVHDYAPY